MIVAGASRSDDAVMRFHPRLPHDTTTLLMLVVFIIAILSTAFAVHAPASEHAVAISSIGAAVILFVYAAWLLNYLRAGAAEGPAIGRNTLRPSGSGPGSGLALVGDVRDPRDRRLVRVTAGRLDRRRS
jgi:hypothetical protein